MGFYESGREEGGPLRLYECAIQLPAARERFSLTCVKAARATGRFCARGQCCGAFRQEAATTFDCLEWSS